MRSAAAVLALALALPAAGTAHAHGFNLGFVAPMSGERAQDGRDALDGLLLATRERDGHPDEHSDGHLGGLDSFIFVIDSAPPDLAGRIGAAVVESGLDIVTAAGPEQAREAARAALDRAAAVFCPPGGGPGAAPLDGVTAARFAEAFRAMFRRDASPAALQGYAAGRTVDRAVRALGGVADRGALRARCNGD